MNEAELIKYFEDRRGDVSTWSDTPVDAAVQPSRSAVFSLRIPAEELDALRQRADEEGTTVSDLIRWSIAAGLRRSSRVPTLTRRSELRSVDDFADVIVDISNRSSGISADSELDRSSQTEEDVPFSKQRQTSSSMVAPV